MKHVNIPDETRIHFPVQKQAFLYKFKAVQN